MTFKIENKMMGEGEKGERMEKNDVVIVSAVRTPFGKFGGTLKDIPSIELGAMVIREVLKRVNVKGEEVEETYYGAAVPERSVWKPMSLRDRPRSRQGCLQRLFPLPLTVPVVHRWQP